MHCCALIRLQSLLCLAQSTKPLRIKKTGDLEFLAKNVFWNMPKNIYFFAWHCYLLCFFNFTTAVCQKFCQFANILTNDCKVWQCLLLQSDWQGFKDKVTEEHYSNFCTFEIASIVNVPRHYLRKYGMYRLKTPKTFPLYSAIHHVLEASS